MYAFAPVAKAGDALSGKKPGVQCRQRVMPGRVLKPRFNAVVRALASIEAMDTESAG